MSTITALVSLLFRVYSILILIRVLLTWVSVSPYHPAVRILHQVTDPVILPLRRLIPPIGGTVDVSPIASADPTGDPPPRPHLTPGRVVGKPPGRWG
jgi:YggT family protein